jgi:hypothetical protein
MLIERCLDIGLTRVCNAQVSVIGLHFIDPVLAPMLTKMNAILIHPLLDEDTRADLNKFRWHHWGSSNSLAFLFESRSAWICNPSSMMEITKIPISSNANPLSVSERVLYRSQTHET